MDAVASSSYLAISQIAGDGAADEAGDSVQWYNQEAAVPSRRARRG